MKKIFLFAILLLILLDFVSAQNYRYTIYDTETSGLPQNQVISIFQDSRGNIWLGTKFGVAKYDGKRFKTYSPEDGLTAGDINAIFETKKGEILLCSVQGGITKIKGDSIVSYPKFGNYMNYRFYQIKDSLYVAARYPSKKYKYALFSFFKGNYKLLNGKQRSFNFRYLNDTVWCTQKDSTGRYSFGYLDKKYRFKDIGLDMQIQHTLIETDTLYLKNEKAVYKYYKGQLTKLFTGTGVYFFSTGTKGLYSSERKNKDIVNEYDFSGKLKDIFQIPDFRSVMTDKEGNAWFATENGLYKLAERAFRHYVFDDYGLSISNPGVIIDKDDKLWLSSFNGKLYLLNNKDDQFINFSSKLPFQKPAFIISRIVKPDGTIIWGGSITGVIKKKGKYLSHAKLNGISTTYGLFYDSLDNVTLYGHRYGILIENAKNKVIFNLDTVKNMGTILAIDKDTAGYYWLTNRRLVYKLKNGRLQKVSTPQFMTGAYDILHDSKHNLWFGGESGLIFFNNHKFRKISHPSLKNKAVTALYEIGDSVLLIGTTAGLATLDLRTFYTKNKVVMKFYNNRNGFSGYECAQTGFCEDKNGFVWIPVNDRLIKIDPRHLNFRNIQVKPYISSVSVMQNNEWKVRDSSIHELSYDEDRIKFNFSGPYFSNPVSYSYFLKGYDKNWSGYGNAEEAMYSNLPHGKYTFYVKAANGDESGKVLKASYSFNIKPAIWETLWFYIVAIILFLAMVYAVYLFNIKKTAAEYEEKVKRNKLIVQSQIAQLDPHFIFNTLTAAGTVAIRLRELDIYDMLVSLSKLLRLQIKDEKITRTLEEELSLINKYCVLNKTIHSGRFDFFIEIDKNVDTSIKIIKLSVQNFVENAIKHGIENITEQGIIRIKVEQGDIYTRITIGDNGIGYNTAIQKRTRRQKKGLSTIRNTFDLYNKQNFYKLDFKIKDKSDTDKNGRGTIVEIQIPNGYDFKDRDEN